MSYYGNIHCENCGKETRFLIEKEKKIHTIMDETSLANGEVIGTYECDFCINENTVKIIQKNGIIEGFSNGNGKENRTNIMVEQEAEKMYELFETTYENHPMKCGETIEINQNKYTIKNIFIKENVEMDTQIRNEEDIQEQIVYVLENEEKEMKYAAITDLEQKYLYYDKEKIENDTDDFIVDLAYEPEYNGVLADFLPLGVDKEELIEITNERYEKTVEYEGKMGDSYVKIEHALKGYRGYIYDKLGILLFDIYKENFDQVMSEIDDLLLAIEK